MRETTRLLEELSRDIERDPASWTRVQDWLTKTFLEHGRVGLRLFGGWPYVLELDANRDRPGNLDNLTVCQAWRAYLTGRQWLKNRHAGIHEALADWHRNPDTPMAEWVKNREKELRRDNSQDPISNSDKGE